jgi:CHASE2 domain-containing sensor protein|tara:strand:- start:5116 stop:5268 length:153 start_codon:yes stop_codon:yes gene_type:complete
MIDTLKTAGVGLAGSSIAWTQWVPPLFSALAACATLAYMMIKIYKEIKNG